MMVSAAALINNGCRFECVVAGYEDKALKTGECVMVCVSLEE